MNSEASNHETVSAGTTPGDHKASSVIKGVRASKDAIDALVDCILS